jgi:hypothetical protein
MLREFKGYVDRSFESPGKIAARVGVTYSTIWACLVGKNRPGVKSLPRLRAFLDAEAKRQPQSDGNRPIEHVPYKIIKPIRQVRYARLCPFCREARGKIRSISRNQFQGAYSKVGANGPKRERAAQPFFQTPLACSLADGNVVSVTRKS